MNNTQQDDMSANIFRQESNATPAYFVNRDNGWEIYSDTRNIIYIATKYTFFNVDNGFAASAYSVRGFISDNGNWVEGDIYYHISSLRELTIILNRSGAFKKAISEIGMLENQR